jgi:hypothetical protein
MTEAVQFCAEMIEHLREEEGLVFEGPFRLPWNHPAIESYLMGQVIIWVMANPGTAENVLRYIDELDPYPESPAEFLQEVTSYFLDPHDDGEGNPYKH